MSALPSGPFYIRTEEVSATSASVTNWPSHTQHMSSHSLAAWKCQSIGKTVHVVLGKIKRF